MYEISHKTTTTEAPSVITLRALAQATYLQIIINFAWVLLSLDYRHLRMVERSLSLVQLITHPKSHKKVIKALSAPSLHPLLIHYPKLSLRYLKPAYLALDLTISQRADAFSHHYSFMCDRIDKQQIMKILFDELFIWTYSYDESTHCMSVLLSRTISNEGELSIHYVFNSYLIYVLSFTFVNGQMFGMEDETVVFVTRIQGVRNIFTLVRSATKSLKDVSPPFALMAALEGFASALGIKILIGASARQQASSGKDEFNSPEAYDTFFGALGATRIAAEPATLSANPRVGYFRLLLPISEKPITDIKRSHRSRTNAKRKLRKQISNTVYDATLHFLLTHFPKHCT